MDETDATQVLPFNILTMFHILRMVFSMWSL